MIQNLKVNSEKLRDYDSEFLLKILKKTFIAKKNSDDKELFLNENWKITSKEDMDYKINSYNSNLKRILSEIFPDKKILIQDNKDGSQTILLS